MQNFDSHSRDVREELHKRKSLACRLNTDCFRVALPRMGHPGSRDFTFQYLQLPQIFTTTECPDIHVPQSRDPAFFSSRQSDHTGLPHCSKSLRDKTIFVFKKNSTVLYVDICVMSSFPEYGISDLSCFSSQIKTSQELQDYSILNC